MALQARKRLMDVHEFATLLNSRHLHDVKP